jgi:sodium/potassium-transporting ATPase subunit alpha
MKLKKQSKSAVIEANYLNQITENELDSLLINYKEVVFARASPIQKQRIVSSLQRLNYVVAVTGDGINDVPALKKADIGIAMGITGSDVSKEAADMILLDDNFSTIQNAIEEGRLIHDNLKKAIAYTLTTKIAELSPFIFYIIAEIPLPLSTVGILLIGICSQIITPISFSFEKSESNLMNRDPIDKNDGLINERFYLLKIFDVYDINNIHDKYL